MKQGFSNRMWLRIVGAILAVSAAASLAILLRPASGSTAIITLDGAEVERVNLSAMTESYTQSFTGKSGITNVVEFAPGKIQVKEADCPDQICVRQGWIETGTLPIVCLPNQLVIEIQDERNDTGVDASTQ